MSSEREAHQRAEGWLRRAVRMAPHPMQKGRFPQIMVQAEGVGFERATILDVLDEWLNYGYIQLTDPLSCDFIVLPTGEDMLVAGPPKIDEDAKK